MNIGGVIVRQEEVKTFKKHISERIRDRGNFVLTDKGNPKYVVTIKEIKEDMIVVPSYDASRIATNDRGDTNG